MTEEKEAALEADRARLRASLKVTRRVFVGIAAALALALTYAAGEMAGVGACQCNTRSLTDDE